MTPIEQAIELLQKYEDEAQGPRYRRRTRTIRHNPFGERDHEQKEFVRRSVEAMERMVQLMEHVSGPMPPSEFTMPAGMINEVPGGEFTSPRPQTPGEMPKNSTNCSEFEHQLQGLINKYNIDNETGIPDFVLASFLVRCMTAVEYAVKRTNTWNGKGI